MRTSSRSFRKPLKIGTRSAAVSWSPRITASSWMEKASVRRTFHWEEEKKSPHEPSNFFFKKEINNQIMYSDLLIMQEKCWLNVTEKLWSHLSELPQWLAWILGRTKQRFHANSDIQCCDEVMSNSVTECCHAVSAAVKWGNLSSCTFPFPFHVLKQHIFLSAMLLKSSRGGNYKMHVAEEEQTQKGYWWASRQHQYNQVKHNINIK